MNRRDASRLLLASLLAAPPIAAFAADMAPDAFIRRLSEDVLTAIRADKAMQGGDVPRIMTLVDSMVMPNVNFQRLTASAVGPAWRRATPEQKTRLQQEFKTLLVRTYSGALSQVGDRTVAIRPLRDDPGATELTVRTEIRGRGEPIQLDYLIEKTPGEGLGWKIFNINVLGVWLMETYRSQFAAEINARGIDGLIATLVNRNRGSTAAAKD